MEAKELFKAGENYKVSQPTGNILNVKVLKRTAKRITIEFLDGECTVGAVRDFSIKIDIYGAEYVIPMGKGKYRSFCSSRENGKVFIVD